MIIKTVNIESSKNYEIRFNESSKELKIKPSLEYLEYYRQIYHNDAKTAVIHKIARYTNSDSFAITFSKLTKINRYTEFYIHYLGSIEKERIQVKTFFDEKFPFKLKYIIYFFDLDKPYIKHYLENRTISFYNKFNDLMGNTKDSLDDFARELGYKNGLHGR